LSNYDWSRVVYMDFWPFPGFLFALKPDFLFSFTVSNLINMGPEFIKFKGFVFFFSLTQVFWFLFLMFSSMNIFFEALKSFRFVLRYFPRISTGQTKTVHNCSIMSVWQTVLNHSSIILVICCSQIRRLLVQFVYSHLPCSSGCISKICLGFISGLMVLLSKSRLRIALDLLFSHS